MVGCAAPAAHPPWTDRNRFLVLAFKGTGASRVLAMVPIRTPSISTIIILVGVSLALTACGDASKLPEQSSVGSSPTLPEPNQTFIPTVHVAKATGWPEGAKPTPSAGLAVNAFATGLEHPRWLLVLPN